MNPIAEPESSDRPCVFPVLAWLGAHDVARARVYGAAFSLWETHRDFVADRDALFVGYGSAGVSARFWRVAFRAFEQWMRLTGAPATVEALDEFAAHCALRAARPGAPVIGRTGVPGDPERNAVVLAGAQCVPILADVYRRWRDDFGGIGLIAPPDLDGYATHVVACCVASAGRERRPALSSS